MTDNHASGERTSILYARPDPVLARYVSGYHIYSVRLGQGETLSDVFYPGWGSIRFTFATEPWSIRIGSRLVNPVPEDSLFGPSSRAGYAKSGSGVVIGAGLTPLGWGRFVGNQAWKHADRVVPLAPILGEEAARLRSTLAAGGEPKRVFDEYFATRLAYSSEGPEEVARLLDLIEGGLVASVADLAERTGLDGRLLVRMSRGYFGFTPKLLLRRGRFLRTLIAVTEAERGCWASCAEAAGYYDQSHFLRDCRLFLDMPLGRFLAHPKPLAAASLTQRREVLGAPVQSLHSLVKVAAAPA
jgi:AraC-like DNA-binding protein